MASAANTASAATRKYARPRGVRRVRRTQVSNVCPSRSSRSRVRPGPGGVDTASQAVEPRDALREVGERDRVEPRHGTLAPRHEQTLPARLDHHLALVVPGPEGGEPELVDQRVHLLVTRAQPGPSELHRMAVDHSALDAAPHPVSRLQHDHVAARPAQLLGCRQPGKSRADHDHPHGLECPPVGRCHASPEQDRDTWCASISRHRHGHREGRRAEGRHEGGRHQPGQSGGACHRRRRRLGGVVLLRVRR